MHAAQCLPLLQAPAGSRVTVDHVVGDNALRSKLSALGITPGTPVDICPHCTCYGSKRIRVRESSLVVGETVAAQIMCRTCASENVSPGQQGTCLKAQSQTTQKNECFKYTWHKNAHS